MKKFFLPFLLPLLALAQLPHPATLSPSSSSQSAAVWNAQANALATAAVGGVYFPGNNGTIGSIRTTLYNGTTLSAIGTNAFTLWFRFRETSTDGSCVFALYEPSAGTSYIVLNMSSGRPYIEKTIAGASQTAIVFDSLKGRLSGSLTDFVVVRNAGTLTYYWNGVATVGTSGADSAGTINLSSSASLYVGGAFTAAQNFDSLVNRSVVFNRALTAAEVLSLGTYGVARTDQWGSTATPGCILDLDLTYGTGTTVMDRSGNLTPTTTGTFTHQLPRSASASGVTSVSVTPTNGVSATVANPTTTPALSFTLDDITPTTVYLRGTDAVSNAWQMQYISEAIPRAAWRKDGVILFGSGSAVPDVNLYRSGVNVLKTDTAFSASSLRAIGAGGLTVGASYAAITAPASGAIFEGSVGFGNSAPALPVHATGGSQGWPATSGTSQPNGTLRLQQNGSSLVTDFGGNAGSGAWVQVTAATALSGAYPLMLNPNGGKVRIGSTTAPSQTLDVTGGIGASGSIYGSSSIITNALQVGSLGVNVAAPLVQLNVKQTTTYSAPTLGTGTGSFFLGSSGNSYGLYGGVSGAGPTWLQVMRNDSATAYDMQLQPSGGKVAIGKSSAAAYMLDVAGSIGATTLDVTGAITGGASRVTSLYSTNDVVAGGLLLRSGTNTVAATLNGAGNRWLLGGGLDPGADGVHAFGQAGARWASGAFAGIVLGSYFQSDVATGTAPLVVASTTKVTNLNADLLDGLDSAALQPASANLTNVANLTAQSLPSTIISVTENTQTGTTYTVSITDNGKVVTLNNAGVITVTVPTLSAAFSATFIQKGAGQVTFSASGTTINNAHSQTKTYGQYAAVTLYGLSSTSFVLAGDTGP